MRALSSANSHQYRGFFRESALFSEMNTDAWPLDFLRNISNALSATLFNGMCRTDPFLVFRRVILRATMFTSVQFKRYCSLFLMPVFRAMSSSAILSGHSL